MTLCVAWLRETERGEQLVLATDSLITGGFRYPYGTKLMTFSRRKDCALAWEGDTSFTYSFTENARVDVDFSDGLAASDVPLVAVKRRIVKVFNQLWQANLDDPNSMYYDTRLSFLFGGYCPYYQKLQLWHIWQSEDRSKFISERRGPSRNKPWFIGSAYEKALQVLEDNRHLSPCSILLHLIEDESVADVGGVPQVVTIDREGLRVVGVVREEKRYLFGRQLNSRGHKSHIHYMSYRCNEFDSS